MKNKDFDQFIKQSLENVDGSEYIPMDWSLMDDKLGVDGLDDLVKESLGDLEGQEYAPMNWALMTSKLDVELGADTSLDEEMDAQMEDIHLDTVAYNHLENLNAPYNKEHWKIMEARLDEEYAYRRKVLLTKIMEAAVVLLLVWTAINFFPNKKNTTSHKGTPVANSNQNKTNNFNEVYVPNQLISENITISKVEKNTKISVNETLLEPNSDDDFKQTFSTDIPPTGNVLIKEASLGEQMSSPFIQNKNESSNSSSSSVDEEVTDNEPVKKDEVLTDVFPLSRLVSSALLYQNSKKDLTTYSGFLKKRKLRTHDFFFSMFSSADFNYVQSDFYNIKIREDDVYTRSQKGYGGGFSLGFQLKRLLVETGVVYSFIRYQQREEAKITGNFIDGYVKEKWQGAELNMLQVPLNIQYSFLLKRKWRMYSLTGISLNMALQNNFDYQLDVQDNPNSSLRSPAPIKNESEIATEAIESKGFFEGGGFVENSYLTANLGFGLERKFTYRWSLYLQPVYQHHFLFEGIGPNKDRINSGSLRLGAKVKIW